MGQNTTGTTPQNQELIDFFNLLNTDQGAADWAAYTASQQPVSEPVLGGMGNTTNEEYRAAKLANQARIQAETDWYRSVAGTPDSPFYGSVGSEIDGQKIGWWYDLDGQMHKDFMPEWYAYDPEYEVMRQSSTDPTNRMENRDYGGLTTGGELGPNGTGPGATFGKPPDFNTPAITTNPAIPPNRGTDPLKPYTPPTSGGTPGPPVWGGGQVGGTLPIGGGGVTGPATDPFDWSSVIAPPKHGYESSSNKDFYQRQFQEMHGSQNVQKLRELANYARAQEAANQPAPAAQDPWAWANLPTVQQGGSVAATPIEWGLNSSYGITPGMTNQQALQAVSGVLTPTELAIMQQQFQNNPASATNTNWTTAGSPGALTSRPGGDALSPEFIDARNKVFNNIYTQTGGGTGGMAVPTGYANPINA